MASFDEIDEFERAASAFPDLDDDLGGFGSISGAPAAPAPIASIPNEPLDFSFDPLPSNTGPPVRITGDDEIEKFENQFPDIGEVSRGRWDARRRVCVSAFTERF